jgi:glutathione S-transferase
MTDRLPPLGAMLTEEAPRVAALMDRLSGTPALSKLRRQSDEAWGEVYCGGRIERSLRAVLA